MFSKAEKQFIAAEVEKLLLSLKHPEMPLINPSFTLHVDGKEDWSWADIKPNWTYHDTQVPGVNPFNEQSRELHQQNQPHGTQTNPQPRAPEQFDGPES